MEILNFYCFGLENFDVDKYWRPTFKAVISLEYELDPKLTDMFWGNDGFLKEDILL